MNQNFELKLQALLDGELPPTEAEQVRRQAASDPEAARLLAELQVLKAAFIQNEHSVGVPESREFYWSKILRQIEHEQPIPDRPAPASPWLAGLRWIGALSGVAALAAVLIFALHRSPHQIAYNQVSVVADGFQARTIQDQPSGLTFVFLHDTRAAAESSAQLQPAHTRDDGSSFVIETE